MSLFVGTARRDITPDWPVMLGGFGQRTTASTGTLDRVHAKALHLLDTDADERILLLTTDLIATPAPIAKAVVARLSNMTGLAASSICISASHSPSAPVPFDPSPDATGVARFSSSLIEALVDVGQRAVATSRPARLRTAVGRVGFLHNRWTRGNPNHVDDRVCVAVFDDASTDRPMSVLFGVGCHPVTLGWDNMAISADYPGVAQRLIEERLGASEALFFNTTEGSVIPNTRPNCDSLDPRGYCGGSYHDTLDIGTQLADAVLDAVQTATVFAGPGPVAARRVDLTLDPNTGGMDPLAADERLLDVTAELRSFLGDGFETVPAAAMWSAASAHVVEHDLSEPEMRRLMIATCLFLGLTARRARGGATPPVNVPVQVLRIGPFELLALPGEPMLEVGEEWQRRVGDKTGFVMGLSNSHLRYLPRQAQFEQSDSGSRYETVTAGLAPHGVEVILDRATEMLAALAR